MSAPKRMNRPRRANALKSSMFPHTVTVYTTTVEYDDEYNEMLTNHITILRGVLLDASKGVNVRSSGLEGADAVILYIPFGVDAVDGVTGATREYVPPIEFWKLEDHAKAWTLSGGAGTGGNKDASTFFIKGEVVEPERDRDFLEKAYDDVYSITKIDCKDFGGVPHWEVGGV